MKGKNPAQSYRQRRIARGFSGPSHVWRKTAFAAATAIPIGAVVNWEAKVNVAAPDGAGFVDADNGGSVDPGDLRVKSASAARDGENGDNNSLQVTFKGRLAVNKEMTEAIRRAVALYRRGTPLNVRETATLLSQYYGALPLLEDLQNRLPPELKPRWELTIGGMRSNLKDVEEAENSVPPAGEEKEGGAEDTGALATDEQETTDLPTDSTKESALLNE